MVKWNQSYSSWNKYPTLGKGSVTDWDRVETLLLWIPTLDGLLAEIDAITLDYDPHQDCLASEITHEWTFYPVGWNSGSPAGGNLETGMLEPPLLDELKIQTVWIFLKFSFNRWFQLFSPCFQDFKISRFQTADISKIQEFQEKNFQLGNINFLPPANLVWFSILFFSAPYEKYWIFL